MSFNIPLEDNIGKLVMPENLSIGMMVARQHKKCQEIGCEFDYYGFAFGQSPFPVPDALQKPLSENSHAGHYSDSAGINDLREAFAGFNLKHFALDISPERIIVGPGTKTIIFMIFSIVKANVIIPSPSWIGYSPLVKFLGKEPLSFPLSPENDYKIDPGELDSFLNKRSGHDLLVLNNPNNPTGVVYKRDELKQITEICRKHGTLVLSDEIYALTTYELENFHSMGAIYPEGTFVTNGLSKDRSAGGYRLGTCVLPEQTTSKLKDSFIKLAASLYSNVTTPIQLAAINAYQENPRMEEYFHITRNIHRIMGKNLSEKCNQIEGLKATVPAGGFYFLLDFNQLGHKLREKGIISSDELAPALLAHPYHIATVTGRSVFVAPTNFSARISFVDYDGKAAYQDYKTNPQENKAEEEKFLAKHGAHMLSGLNDLKEFVAHLME